VVLVTFPIPVTKGEAAVMMKEAAFTLNPAAATRLRPPTHTSLRGASDETNTDTPARNATVLTTRTWDETVRTHQASIYRLAYRLTGNSHDAEDLTQDVFVNVLLYPSTFSPSVSGSRLHRVTKALYGDQILPRDHGVHHGFLGEGAGNRLLMAEDAASSSSVATHRQFDAMQASDTGTVK
jgi:hypothetical protein